MPSLRSLGSNIKASVLTVGFGFQPLQLLNSKASGRQDSRFVGLSRTMKDKGMG